MNKNVSYIVILLAFLLIRNVSAQEINTLFTTPEERAYLDFLREEFLFNSALNDFDIDEVVPAIPVIEEVVENEPDIITYTLGGIFTRNDGNRVVWLNDVSIDENMLPQSMMLVRVNEAVRLRIQTESGSFDLRPGQTLDVINGQVLESWQFTLPEQDNVDMDTDDTTQEPIIEVQQQDNAADNDLQNSTTVVIDELAPPLETESLNLVLSTEELVSVLEEEGNEEITVDQLLQRLQNSEQSQTDGNAQ